MLARMDTKSCSTLALILTLTCLPAFAAAQDEHLPTPYSADQIRDAWQVGLTVVTRVSTPRGESTSHTIVTDWTEEKVALIEQPLDDMGQAVGEATPIEVSWTDLRDHARFPTSAATRERTKQSTPLGDLEGWRYIMKHGETDQSEFFFADAYPGPPVVFLRRSEGEVVMRAEMIEREISP